MTEIDQHSQPQHRSKWLITTSILIAIFQLFSMIRLFQLPVSLRNQLEIVVRVDLISGIIWAVIFSVALYFLVRHHPKAQRLTSWLVISFIGYRLLRLIIFAQADYDRQRLLFLSLFIIVVCCIPIWKLLQPDQGANHT